MSPSPSLAPSTPVPSPKSGGRKWLIFGCGGCLTLIVLGALAFGAIFFFAMGAIKKTDVYEDAFKSAEQSTEVQAALGTPLKTGWLLQGSINYTNGAGNAEFTVPLSGPKGEATLAVTADKPAGGAWKYSVLEVRRAGGDTIDLRETR